MIKTVNLSGRETRVEGLDGFNTIVHNLGEDVIYASKNPNIAPEADNVAEIPPGSAKLISTTNGTVYLLGIGKTELTGQDYDGVNYSSPSTAAVISSGGSTTSDVTKAYVNAQDALTLEASMSYADSVVNAAKEDIGQKLTETSDRITANSENISALQTEKVDKSDMLEWLNTKADKSEVSDALDSAKAYTDEKLVTVNDSIAELQDTKADKSDIPEASVSSNPNLLDNWYFITPVNQRNAYNTVTKLGYCIDRWKLTAGSVNIHKNNGGIILNGTIEQILEKPGPVQTVTASYLTPDGVKTAKYDSATRTVSITTDIETLIIAAKLEVGTNQTLAHQEDDGWVLNDAPPSETAELERCMRYQIIGKLQSAQGDAKTILVPLPVPMRDIPAVLGGWDNGISYYDANGASLKNVTACPWSGVKWVGNGIMFNMTNTSVRSMYFDDGFDANL